MSNFMHFFVTDFLGDPKFGTLHLVLHTVLLSLITDYSNSAQTNVKLNIPQLTYAKLAQSERDESGSQEVISNRPIESLVSHLCRFSEQDWSAAEY